MFDRLDGLRQGRDVGVEPLMGLDVDVGASVDGFLHERLRRQEIGVSFGRLPEEKRRELGLAAEDVEADTRYLSRTIEVEERRFRGDLPTGHVYEDEVPFCLGEILSGKVTHIVEPEAFVATQPAGKAGATTASKFSETTLLVAPNV